LSERPWVSSWTVEGEGGTVRLVAGTWGKWRIHLLSRQGIQRFKNYSVDTGLVNLCPHGLAAMRNLSRVRLYDKPHIFLVPAELLDAVPHV
jgi:hypothetical protein